MHPNRFDAMARSVAPIRSRRALFGLAAGAMTALVGSGSIDVQAQPRAKKKCKAGETKCKKKCCKTGDICAKGKCVTGQGTCADNADACESATGAICKCSQSAAGLCLRRLQGGVRCGIQLNKTACDQCLNDADCHALGFPPGSSCVKDSGAECPLCASNTLGMCVAPCNFKA